LEISEYFRKCDKNVKFERAKIPDERAKIPDEGENQTKHFFMTICFVFECLWQQFIALESGKWMFAAVHLLLRKCGKMCVTGVLLLVLAFI
jgi:hypothetical protein